MIHNMIGGGAALNFRIVGNPQPQAPQENTIWVNTDTAIAGWVFSAQQPNTSSEGAVWIQTGTFSVVEFNALKKNSIQVCPITAKQFVSGAWVDKTAKSYQNGAWVDWWAGEIYSYGDECESITGGWMADKVSFVNDVTAVEPRITKNSDSVKIDIAQGDANGGVYRTRNKVSFSGKSTLTFTGSANGDNTDRCAIMVWSEMNRDFTVGRVAIYQFGSGFSGDATIDISGLNEDYYVGIHVYGHSNAYVTMQQMKLV